MVVSKLFWEILLNSLLQLVAIALRVLPAMPILVGVLELDDVVEEEDEELEFDEDPHDTTHAGIIAHTEAMPTTPPTIFQILLFFIFRLKIIYIFSYYHYKIKKKIPYFSHFL